ncbi:MAG: phosphoglycerate mutase family protein, partial [Alistipes sp.]|nr:phosphoglycerate mutase family protein [Alistipes sp.]
MEHYTQRAAENTRRAKIIIDTLDLHGLWHAIGAEVRQVGSMRMGLLAKHRDLDFHIYSDAIDLRADFEVMGRLAALPGIVRIEYGNLLDTDEACVEWHAWYRDETGDEWQIDLIHIVRGSRYDGYFERVADRIATALTDERREAILRLKFETPDDLKIMGIEYYQAVIRDGVRTW